MKRKERPIPVRLLLGAWRHCHLQIPSPTDTIIRRYCHPCFVIQNVPLWKRSSTAVVGRKHLRRGNLKEEKAKGREGPFFHQCGLGLLLAQWQAHRKQTHHWRENQAERRSCLQLSSIDFVVFFFHFKSMWKVFACCWMKKAHECKYWLLPVIKYGDQQTLISKHWCTWSRGNLASCPEDLQLQQLREGDDVLVFSI